MTFARVLVSLMMSIYILVRCGKSVSINFYSGKYVYRE